MTRYVEFPTGDGGSILVEAEEQKAEELVKAGLAEKVQDKIVVARATLEATMMTTVRRNAEAFVQTMHSLSEPPAEAELCFGVNASAELGYSAVGKASGESTYTVRLTWKREQGQQEPKE